MSKYVTEGCIDFYYELNKITDISDNDTEKCLITNEILTDKHITLDCGHKFNYYPLYSDLLNHKLKFNNMESCYGTLKCNQFRCPYCRTKYSGWLPYYENMGVPKMPGINCIDYENTKNISCDYQIKNILYCKDAICSDKNLEYIPCLSNKISNNMMLKIHELLNPELNDKCFCTRHVKSILVDHRIQTRYITKYKNIYNRVLKQLVKYVISKSKIKKNCKQRISSKKNGVIVNQLSCSEIVNDLANTTNVTANTTYENTITQFTKTEPKKVLRGRKKIFEETK